MPAHIYAVFLQILSNQCEVSLGTSLRTASGPIHRGRPPASPGGTIGHALQATADWTNGRQLTQIGQSDSFPGNLNQGSEILFCPGCGGCRWELNAITSGAQLQKQWRPADPGPSKVSHSSCLGSSIPPWLPIAQAGFCYWQSVESELKDGLDLLSSLCR